MRARAWLVLTLLLVVADRAHAQDEARFEQAVKALDLLVPAGKAQPRDFTVPLTTGERFRLRKHRGDVVVVNFWATWCAPCKYEMPSLERLWRGRREYGVVVLAVSTDRKPDVVEPFVERYKLTFPVALDPRSEIGKQFGVRALPTTVILGTDGALAAVAYGARSWDSPAAVSLIDALRAP